jgi:hypothetical protein
MSRTKANTKANYKTNGATTQLQFLQSYLRGTNTSITAKQASKMFGIAKLHARLFECKQAGLRIRSKSTGNNKELEYMMSARDTTGSRATLAF